MGAMSIDPTFGLVSLRRGTKIIALLDMTLGLIGIVWFVFMMSRYGIISLDPFEEIKNGSSTYNLGPLDSSSVQQEKVFATNHKAISLTLSALFTIINLAVFVVLLVGAHKKSIGLCLSWFYIRCAVIVFKMIIFVMYLIAKRPIFSQIPYILFMLIHMYGLWVVNHYVEELRSQRRDEKLENIKKERIERVNEAWEAGGIESLQEKRVRIYASAKDNQAFQNEKS